MRPARILLLLIAIVAGGLAAFLATRGSGPATIVQQAAAPAPEMADKVLVAKVPIGVGQRLSAATVEWQPWPENAVRPEYITIAKSPDAPNQVAGAVARFEIFTGEPILDAKLVHSDQGFMSAVLEPGMRGVSIPIEAASGSGGFIIPNDRVDVVLTDNATGGQTTSKVVLSDVKVLAIGSRLGQTGTTGAPTDPSDPKSQIFAQSIATLELTPPQAQTLINASASGKIALVLRSVADFAKGATTTSASASDNQTVKIIRFGRELSVSAGSPDQTPAVSPVAYVPPAMPVAAPTMVAPAVTVAAPGATTTNGDGTVTVTSPATTVVTTTTSPGAVAPASTN